MGGCVTSKDDLEKMTSRNKLTSYVLLNLESENVIPLPKGGLLIKTKIGNVQFGMPPETIKDSMNIGLDVPKYFIVPSKRFETRLGLSVAEFEFPAYFNFFMKKRQVNLIVDKEGEEAIRTIFQETLLGPADVSVVRSSLV